MEEAVELANGIKDSVTTDSPGDVGLFVPFPFIEKVQKIAGDKFIVGAEVSSTNCRRYGRPHPVLTFFAMMNVGHHTGSCGCFYGWYFPRHAEEHGY